jgi:hypothetical protein
MFLCINGHQWHSRFDHCPDCDAPPALAVDYGDLLEHSGDEIARLRAINADLLAALKLLCDFNPSQHYIDEVARRHEIARIAIAKAHEAHP